MAIGANDGRLGGSEKTGGDGAEDIGGTPVADPARPADAAGGGGDGVNASPASDPTTNTGAATVNQLLEVHARTLSATEWLEKTRRLSGGYVSRPGPGSASALGGGQVDGAGDNDGNGDGDRAGARVGEVKKAAKELEKTEIKEKTEEMVEKEKEQNPQKMYDITMSREYREWQDRRGRQGQ